MLTLTPAQQDYHEEEIRAGGVGSLMVQDPALMKKTARMAARESHSGGVAWHFAPMVDIARDARWGRVFEGPARTPACPPPLPKRK